MANKITEIKERVLQIAKYHGVSYEKFSNEIGMSYASFKGKAKFTPLNSDAIANIITIYPDVDCYWLLTGNGQMLKNNEASAEKNDKNSERIDKLLDIVASSKDDRIISQKGCGGCAGCCWQGGTRIKQPERFILTPDYPIKDAALPYNLNITTTTKRITKLDILLFHAFAE